MDTQALAHLAYIRLAANIGPARSLLDSSHTHIAKRLNDQPGLQRGPFLLLAAKHAVRIVPFSLIPWLTRSLPICTDSSLMCTRADGRPLCWTSAKLVSDARCLLP